MKIGLVSPYVYPLPGGVTQHVRHLYENLRLRGHDVRIITSSHGLQRASEGDIIRLGKGFSHAGQRLGRHADRLAALRVAGPGRARARAVRPAPLPRAVRAVPVADRAAASRAASTSRRSTRTRLLAGLRVRRAGCWPATSARLHGRIAVSARPRATSSTATSRATTRSSPTASTSTSTGAPSRSRAGRTGRYNILFVGRLEPRKGLLDLLKAYRLLRRVRLRLPAPDRGHRPAGARGAALRDDAAAARRGVPRPRQRRREGAAVPHRRRVRVAGDGRRVVRDRAARGDGRGRADRLQRHPRLQGRRPPRRAGAARAAARPGAARRARSRGSSPNPTCARG